MKARDLAYETFLALNANRVRSLLTILGVVIGISAVIAMTAVIGGIKQSLVGELGLSQARLITVNYWGSRSIRLDDVYDMAEDLESDLELVMPVANSSGEIISTTEKKNGSITGVMPEYFSAMNMKFVAGDSFTHKDLDSGAQMVTMDEGTARALMGGAMPAADVVGKTVRIGGSEYQVCGVLEGSSSTQYGDDYVTVYAPFNTVTQRLTGSTNIDAVYALARSEDADMEAVATRIKEWMGKRLNLTSDEVEDEMWVQTMKSIIQQLDTTMASFQMLMTLVASISLVVGGIGIMNMMLTNVTERIREIGLRKALGAHASDITSQFLLESVLLTVIGGIIGILVGMGLAYALAGIAASAFSGGSMETMESGGVTPVLEPAAMLQVAGICVGIGIVFGYYPARRAAKLDPVESLHYQ